LSWGWLGGLKSLGDFDLDGKLGRGKDGNMVKLVEHQSFGGEFFNEEGTATKVIQ